MKIKIPETIVRILILAAAAAFIAYGLYSGAFRDVLVKATHICMECIGLG